MTARSGEGLARGARTAGPVRSPSSRHGQVWTRCRFRAGPLSAPRRMERGIRPGHDEPGHCRALYGRPDHERRHMEAWRRQTPVIYNREVEQQLCLDGASGTARGRWQDVPGSRGGSPSNPIALVSSGRKPILDFNHPRDRRSIALPTASPGGHCWNLASGRPSCDRCPAVVNRIIQGGVTCP